MQSILEEGRDSAIRLAKHLGDLAERLSSEQAHHPARNVLRRLLDGLSTLPSSEIRARIRQACNLLDADTLAGAQKTAAATKAAYEADAHAREDFDGNPPAAPAGGFPPEPGRPAGMTDGEARAWSAGYLRCEEQRKADWIREGREQARASFGARLAAVEANQKGFDTGLKAEEKAREDRWKIHDPTHRDLERRLARAEHALGFLSVRDQKRRNMLLELSAADGGLQPREQAELDDLNDRAMRQPTGDPATDEAAGIIRAAANGVDNRIKAIEEWKMAVTRTLAAYGPPRGAGGRPLGFDPAIGIDAAAVTEAVQRSLGGNGAAGDTPAETAAAVESIDKVLADHAREDRIVREATR